MSATGSRCIREIDFSQFLRQASNCPKDCGRIFNGKSFTYDCSVKLPCSDHIPHLHHEIDEDVPISVEGSMATLGNILRDLSLLSKILLQI